VATEQVQQEKQKGPRSYYGRWIANQRASEIQKWGGALPGMWQLNLWRARICPRQENWPFRKKQPWLFR